MLSFIQELIKNNPLITTMYSGGIIAILVMHSRIILEFIWQHLINLISFNITNVSKALDFGMNECTDLDTFLQNQKHLIQRSYEITNTNKIKEGYGKTMSNLVLERNESSDDFGVAGNNKDKLTLSDILNVLDGLYTSEGAICFFTTNHIEHLDDAFLRDGRMDYKVELSNLDNITANKMIYDKLGLDNLFKKCSINPATLQELIRQVKWKKITITDFEKMINNDK